MRILFWFSLATVIYAYVGYPALLAVMSQLRSKPVRLEPNTPSVSVIIAAHNEQARLLAKLEDLRAADYPADRLQIVVASDGSTDATNRILENEASWITPVLLPVAQGKANALNHAVRAATGDLLVFLDVRQSINAQAIAELASCFADPQIGAASGELMLLGDDGLPSPDGLGLYWKIEKLTRKLESETGSVVGVTGAIYAMRRELFVPIPLGTLLDDVLIPMQVARAGHRVIFHPGAIARDRVFPEPRKEFGRKVRTLTGNYQLLRLAPWLLSPRNPLLFRLISHKLLRLGVPILLILLLFSSSLAPGSLYRIAFVAQLGFYLMALVGLIAPAARQRKAISVAYTFTMLNAAAGVAFYNFLGGRTRWA